MGVKYTITYGSQSKEITDQNNNSFTLAYGNIQSETINAGSGKTLSCKDKMMQADLTIGSHTLACANKVMNNNVVITSESVGEQVTITITGSLVASSNYWGYVRINGVDILRDDTLTVNKGTIIEFWVRGAVLGKGWIEINGDRQTTTSSSGITRTMTANSDVSVGLVSSYGYGRITANGGT